MATNPLSCFFIQFLGQLLKFLVNFTLLKYVTSQRSYGFLITKGLIFGFQILDLKDHFSASLTLLPVFSHCICAVCQSIYLTLNHLFQHQPVEAKAITSYDNWSKKNRFWPSRLTIELLSDWSSKN